MPHPLVDQLRFARSEFKRGLEGLGDEDARRRIGPMNCIAWNVGHLGWQEQRYWLFRAQGRLLLPEVDQTFAYGCDASTPPLDEVLQQWAAITREADPWLDTLDSDALAKSNAYEFEGQTFYRTFGSMMQRTTYHYFYHTGENLAIRQMLGHTDLPEFVGNIDEEAPYRPEAAREAAPA